jgi:hypothetical protein
LAPACREFASKVELPPLGRAAEKELRRRIDLALTWARKHYTEDRGPFRDFGLAVARVAARRFWKQFSRHRLDDELVDEYFRDLCLSSEEALAAYLEEVRTQLTKVQRLRGFRARRERDDDLISDTIVRIVEIVRLGQRPLPFARYERAGLPAFIAIYDDVRANVRRHRRITLVGSPADLPARPSPSAEEMLIEHERQVAIARLPQDLAPRLTRKQQCWLAAFQKAAEQGGWILGGAAWELDAHRSQATRAAARIAATARRYKLLDAIQP